jgi:hypothetical protein
MKRKRRERKTWRGRKKRSHRMRGDWWRTKNGIVQFRLRQ